MSPEAKIVDRIAKLLRKAHGTQNQEEAQAFAAKAQELALRNKLELSEIEWDAQASEMQEVGEHYWKPEGFGLKRKSQRVNWMERLAKVVSRAHQCTILVVPGSNILMVIGTKLDREIFNYVYSYLVREAEQLSEKEYNRFYYECEKAGRRWEAKGYRASWLAGYVTTLARRFHEMQDAVEAEYTGTTALVRVATALQAAEDRSKDLSSGKAAGLSRNSTINRQGVRDGSAAGSRANLSGKAVGTNSPAGRLR